ncbi:MAG: hypothetical protein HYX87_04785 [Chloroflexi bacterium]|nr:hypothetical protein [Chloroflexota bacterium]
MKASSFIGLLVLAAVVGGAAGYAASAILDKNSRQVNVSQSLAGQAARETTPSGGQGATQSITGQQGPGSPDGSGGLFAGAGTPSSVQKVEGNVLTLSVRDGSTVIAKASDKTVIQKAIQGSLSDIALGNYLTVMGDRQNDGSISATTIAIGLQAAGQSGIGQWLTGQQTLAGQQGQGSRRGPGGTGGMGGAGGFARGVTMGSVQKVEGNVIMLTVRDGSSARITVNDKTLVGKMGQGEINDITVGGSITVAGDKNSDGSINATNIIVLPSLGAQG